MEAAARVIMITIIIIIMTRVMTRDMTKVATIIITIIMAAGHMVAGIPPGVLHHQIGVTEAGVMAAGAMAVGAITGILAGITTMTIGFPLVGLGYQMEPVILVIIPCQPAGIPPNLMHHLVGLILHPQMAILVIIHLLLGIDLAVSLLEPQLMKIT